LTEITESLVSEESGPTIKKASVNCMSLQDPKAIYSKIADEFLEDSMRTGSSDLEDLENTFISTSTSDIYILVLDEIDHLLTNSQDLIHTIFELSLRPRSRLVLMGIANALDLTDRFLPRLKARNLFPELLPFLPYTAPQIANVIATRLRSLLSETEKESVDASFIPFMHPAAIQLLSKKVAAASGDLRKAFDICRRAVELVELETRQQQSKYVDAENENPFAKPTAMTASPPRKALTENPNLNSPSRIASAAYTAVNAPKATLSHVARASSSSLGVSVSSRITKLNNHQKALLCALVSKSGTTPMDIRKLRELYGSLANQEGSLGVVKLAAGEFREVVESLEVAGVVDVVRRVGTPRKRGIGQGEESVVSRIGRMDLVTAVGSGTGSEGLGRILAQGL
jgi:cell division control protein 6